MPRVTDSDIKELCSKYRLDGFKQSDNAITGECEEMNSLRDEIHKKARTMVKDINKSMSKTARDIRHLQGEQLNSHYQNLEFMRTVNMVKDVDYAKFDTLKTFYLFRLKDELDQILLADDVEREFRNRQFNLAKILK